MKQIFNINVKFMKKYLLPTLFLIVFTLFSFGFNARSAAATCTWSNSTGWAQYGACGEWQSCGQFQEKWWQTCTCDGVDSPIANCEASSPQIYTTQYLTCGTVQGTLSAWTPCNKICGGGTQTRTCNGSVCGGNCSGQDLSQTCNTQTCIVGPGSFSLSISAGPANSSNTFPVSWSGSGTGTVGTVTCDVTAGGNTNFNTVYNAGYSGSSSGSLGIILGNVVPGSVHYFCTDTNGSRGDAYASVTPYSTPGTITLSLSAGPANSSNTFPVSWSGSGTGTVGTVTCTLSGGGITNNTAGYSGSATGSVDYNGFARSYSPTSLHYSCQDTNGARGDAYATVNPYSVPAGVCGPADGQELYTTPSSNLCSTGTASSVSGYGPWTWTCSGSPAANCSASVYVPPSCPAGSATLSTSTINRGSTTTVSAPAGWSGGSMVSRNSAVASISGATSTGATATGVSAGTTTIYGQAWSYSNGATGCTLGDTPTLTVTATTGTLTSNFPSCTIASGSSNCSVNLTWATTNPVGTSAVTASGMTNVNGNSGTSVPFSVPYNTRTFYLYNSGAMLNAPAGLTITSSCAAGSAWNGTICTPLGGLSGTLTSNSPSCTIPAGSSSCNVNLTWATNNPIGVSAVTASGMSNVNGNSGTSVPFAVPYNSRTFYLYNSGIMLNAPAGLTITSACAGGTSWNGTTCAATGADVLPSMISPAPNSTLTGSTTTFTWSTGTGNQAYWLYVGTTFGASDVYDSKSINQLSASVSNIPTSGQTLYVRLWGNISSGWGYTDYTYTEFTTGATALTANPTSIYSCPTNKNCPTSTLTWSYPAYTSCVGTNFSTGTGSPTAGSLPVTPASNITYSITCTNVNNGTNVTNTAAVTVKHKAGIIEK